MTSGRDGVELGAVRTLFGSGTSLGMDDDQLLERFLGKPGDAAETAFETLVDRHGPMVLGVCRGTLLDPQDAQDAFQATFLVLARKAGSIRRRGSLASWLYGVARKIASRAKADAARRRARERETALPVIVHPVPGREPEDFAALYEEIDRLPGTYRDPIILCYLDGMTYEAAAVHLDCPLGTLSVRLKRARERLRSRLTRRGVAVPAGLLAASLTPSVASAAVPVALARLAVRSASISMGSKAMVAGVVPASVALMTGRMTMMMRLKTLAVGLLVVGGLAVAVTGSLALKPMVAGGTPVPEPLPLQEARSWVHTFPDGTRVELVGISPHPSKPGSWRTPDGAPLVTPPYDHAAYRSSTTRERQICEVAFRVRNQPAKEENLQLQTVPPSSSPSSSPGLDSKGVPIPGIESQSFDFAKDQSSCAIRFGLAVGAWKTEATSIGRDITGLAREKGSVIFGTALEVGVKTFITVGTDESVDQRRVVAMDLQGKEHGPVRGQSVGVDHFSQMEQEYNLPLAEIREFQLQSRQYEWATFDDVALKPRGEPGTSANKKGAE